MADDVIVNAVEVFSAPVEGVIVALGKGISEAQRALDQNSIQTQESIDTDPLLSGQGLQATWYQFPRVDLQIKLSLSVAQEVSSSPPSAPPAAPTGAIAISSAALSRVRLIAQPVSASYQNSFNYSSEAASTITLSIVPVPAPRGSSQAVIAPRMTPADVRSAALQKQPKFVRDQQGNPVATLRFDVNFNSSSRTWYILQYDPGNPSSQPVVAAVDDATGVARAVTP